MLLSWLTCHSDKDIGIDIVDLLSNRYPPKIPWERSITGLDYVTIWLYQAIDPIGRSDGDVDTYWDLYRLASDSYRLPHVSYDIFRDEYLEAHYTILFVIRRQEALWTTTIDNDEPRENKESACEWKHLIRWYRYWVAKWRLADSTKSWGLFLRQATIVIGDRLTAGWDLLPSWDLTDHPAT